MTLGVEREGERVCLVVHGAMGKEGWLVKVIGEPLKPNHFKAARLRKLTLPLFLSLPLCPSLCLSLSLTASLSSALLKAATS